MKDELEKIKSSIQKFTEQIFDLIADSFESKLFDNMLADRYDALVAKLNEQIEIVNGLIGNYDVLDERTKAIEKKISNLLSADEKKGD